MNCLHLQVLGTQKPSSNYFCTLHPPCILHTPLQPSHQGAKDGEKVKRCKGLWEGEKDAKVCEKVQRMVKRCKGVKLAKGCKGWKGAKAGEKVQRSVKGAKGCEGWKGCNVWWERFKKLPSHPLHLMKLSPPDIFKKLSFYFLNQDKPFVPLKCNPCLVLVIYLFSELPVGCFTKADCHRSGFIQHIFESVNVWLNLTLTHRYVKEKHFQKTLMK